VMLSRKATVLVLPITLKHLTTIYCVQVPKPLYPEKKKNYYKYWWTKELDLLKRDSIDSNLMESCWETTVWAYFYKAAIVQIIIS